MNDSVVLLGVQGSGKTVFLSVLDHGFAEPAAFGLSLSGMEDTPTSDYARKKFDHMRDGGEWPPSTNDREFFELSWVARSGVRPLFTMESIDCAGEAIVKALAPGYQPDGGSNATSSGEASSGDSWDNDDDARQTDGGDVSARIRERVAAAKVICLFLNPNDFEKHINDGGDDIGSEEYVRAARQRCGAMERLLDTFLVGPQGENKRIVLVVTQSGQGNRSRAIDEVGGAKAFLFDQNHWLESRERALSARVVAVSAVNNVIWKTLQGECVEPREENRDDSNLLGISWKGARDGMTHFSPHEFPDIRQENNSSGLVEFLLAVGGPLSPELDLLDKALCELRERQFKCTEVRSANSGAEKRLLAAEDLAEAWDVYKKLANVFLSNPRRKLSTRTVRLTNRHLDEEEGRLLHWIVTGREIDAALREGVAKNLDLEDSKQCDEFRRRLAERINKRIGEAANGRECPYLEIGMEDLPSDQWLREQIAEYRKHPVDEKAAKNGRSGDSRNSPNGAMPGGRIALAIFIILVLAMIVKYCLDIQL